MKAGVLSLLALSVLVLLACKSESTDTPAPAAPTASASASPAANSQAPANAVPFTAVPRDEGTYEGTLTFPITDAGTAPVGNYAFSVDPAADGLTFPVTVTVNDSGAPPKKLLASAARTGASLVLTFKSDAPGTKSGLKAGDHLGDITRLPTRITTFTFDKLRPKDDRTPSVTLRYTAPAGKKVVHFTCPGPAAGFAAANGCMCGLTVYSDACGPGLRIIDLHAEATGCAFSCD